MKLLLAITIFLGTLVFGQAFARPNAGSIIKQAAASLTDVALKCPDRIWTGIDWSRHAVLFLADGIAPLIWRGTSGVLEAFPEREVPASARERLYNFFDIGGTSTLVIYLSPEDLTDPLQGYFRPHQLFGLVMHEGFHEFNQSTWAPDKAFPMTLFPLETSPRLQRRMSYDRLKEFLRGDREAIGKAAFWYHSWVQDYPRESSANTDRTEGSARYVDLLATLLAERGCGVSEGELRSRLLSKIDAELDRYFQRQDSSLSSEAYGIGALQMLSLKMNQPNSEWMKSIESGASPGALLFAGINEKSDRAETRFIKDTEARYSEKNDLVRKALGELPKQLDDPSFLRVSFGGIQHPENLWDSFALDPEEKRSVTLVNEDFRIEKGRTQLTLETFGSFFILTDNPCGKNQLVLLAPRKSYDIPSTTLKYRTLRTSVKASGKLQATADGFTWLCSHP